MDYTEETIVPIYHTFPHESKFSSIKSVMRSILEENIKKIQDDDFHDIYTYHWKNLCFFPCWLYYNGNSVECPNVLNFNPYCLDDIAEIVDEYDMDDTFHQQFQNFMKLMAMEINSEFTYSFERSGCDFLLTKCHLIAKKNSYVGLS